MSRLSAALSLILCTATLGAGCSRGGSSDTSSSEWVQTKTLKTAQQLAHEAVVSCDGADCHDSVAMFLHVEPTPKGYRTGRCTMTLVAPDLALTNRHCVPDDLRTAGSACGGRIWAVFPKTERFRAETLECSHIEAVAAAIGTTEAQNVLEKDYAFVRLAARSARPVVGLSSAGLAEGLDLTAVKIDPVSDKGLDGRMNRARCAVVQHTIDLANFIEETSPVGTLQGCGVIPGNSGSPLLDGSNRLRAIIQGVSTDRHTHDELADFATNAACMSVPDSLEGTGYAPPPACDAPPQWKETRSPFELLAASSAFGVFRAGLDADARTGLGSRYGDLGWHAVEIQAGSPLFENATYSDLHGSKFYVVPEPSCLPAAAAGSGDAATTTTLSFSVNVSDGYAAKGPRRQHVLSTAVVEPVTAMLTYSPLDAARSGEALAVYSLDDGTSGPVTLFSGKLPVCRSR